MSLSIADWFSIGGGLVGVAGLGFGFFSVNSEWAYKRIIRRQAKVFPEAFKRLAGEYRKADGVDDETERLRLKDTLALKLGFFALGRQLSRQAMASVGEEGYLVALAVMAKEQPERGDAALIAKVGSIHAPPHARYQVMAAITSLATTGHVRQDDLQDLRKLLNSFRKEMEARHHHNIDEVLAVLRDRVVAA